MKRNIKKVLTVILAAVMTFGSTGTMAVSADSNIRPTKVAAVKKTRNVKVGDSFELKVKMTPKKADDDYLRWSIVGKKGIVKFDDDDRNDDEIELKAVKAGTTTLRCKIKGTKKYTDIVVKVTKPKYTYKISRIGKASRIVEVGDDFELKVKKTAGVKNNDLKWSIADKKIVRFNDKDITNAEVEFEARRTGKTKITCTNKKTNKKITFTITVVPDYDDDDDDD